MEKKFINIGFLPKQLGYKNNVGLANFLCGVIDNKIIVAGGSNFPNETNLNGGTKIAHKDIYVVSDENNGLKLEQHKQLDYNFSDGANVQIENSIYYIVNNNIFHLTLENNEIKFEKYFELPFSIVNCFAKASNKNIIYFGLGNINNESNDKIYSFDVNKKFLEEETIFPYEKRSQVVSSIYNDMLYIFSGGSNVAYTDSFKYSLKNKSWEKLEDIEINNEKISLLGAGHLIYKDNLLVIGGFNKSIWDEANFKLSTLDGEEKKLYREQYLTKEIAEYNWNKNILCYNFEKNEWKSLGKISFDAPCGNGLVVLDNYLYSIMGEIKPGIRTKNIYKINLKSLI